MSQYISDPGELRPLTTEERAVIVATPAIAPTTSNLLKVMGIYAVVNRCAWFPVPDDHPELLVPGAKALQTKAVDLGRHCNLWPYFSLDDFEEGKQLGPEDFREWDYGSYRLGLSNTGLDRNNVKIQCGDSTKEPGNLDFSIYPNTDSSNGDYDQSIKLIVRFAEGIQRVSTMSDEAAWQFMLRSCEDTRLVGYPGILEDGWK